jgi:alkanesulfonate monooxygenase SsuD/methylene tetrahydromethanopterin reductase-like flavin-dependent oxidoreductase (luciferase family)
VGTGEALNEHVTGAKWPAADERLEMLEEAVTIITELFTGEQLTYDSIPGESAQLLPLPRHFGQLAELVTEDMVTAPCGPLPPSGAGDAPSGVQV